jgi:hypothetical protein
VIPINDLNKPSVVDAMQCSIKNQIDSRPALSSWVNDVMKQQRALIKTTQHCFQHAGYKFGIGLPIMVDEALYCNAENQNKFWNEAFVNKNGK